MRVPYLSFLGNTILKSFTTDLACKCAAEERRILAGGVGHNEGVIGAVALDTGGCRGCCCHKSLKVNPELADISVGRADSVGVRPGSGGGGLHQVGVVG